MGKSIPELIDDLVQQLPAADSIEASRIKDRITDLMKLEKELSTP